MANTLVVGSFNMDLVVRMPAIPRPGETLLGGVFATFPGGKGSNQAVAAARLGGDVTMIGRVGADAFGSQLLEMAQKEGINTTYVGIDPQASTGVALITIDAAGQNSIAVASGANFTLKSEDVSNAWEKLPHVDLLVMPLEIPLETVQIAARLANQNGVRVLLNPAPMQPLSYDLLKTIDVLIPNELEAASILGFSSVDSMDPREMAASLMRLGCRNVILTLGEKGALVAEGKGYEINYTQLPAYVVQVLDTTAAGDTFVGALAVALGEGATLVEAARFASAAAAISVTRLGAQPSIPYRAEVDEFLR